MKKIYTKTGDKGTTMLFGGDRVAKNHQRIEAYGTLDELNSFVGLLLAKFDDNASNVLLNKVQHKLFDAGSLLATVDEKFLASMPAVNQSNIDMLEQSIDQMQTHLPQLKEFILPRGNEAAAIAHICRTVCRRAERIIVTLDLTDHYYQYIVPYINRLSDYFFVLARYILHTSNVEEIVWKPNK